MTTLEEAIVGLLATQLSLIVALSIIVGRLRERMTRLEEWVRLREIANGRRE